MGFTLQGIGPFLHWMTLGILVLFPILAAYVLFKLGGLPGSIARSRGHPQADAITVCGWMGIITIVLWPIALVWAHLVPGKPIAGGASDAQQDQNALMAKIQKASARLADIERKLPQRTGA
jgi:hypothetical protein